MTNPNDAIGVNAAYGTRTSTNAFNDICQLVNGRGVLSGWSVVPKTGMTVEVGGVAGTRDVAIGEDNLGNRITFNNRIGTAVEVEIAAASASANRYDAIVLYAKNPAIATAASPIPQDAPSVCGIIDVQGDALGVSDAQIRAAITADGGAGTNAYYAVIATIYVGQGTTAITGANITMNHVALSASDIADGEITSTMINWPSMGAIFEKYDSKGSKSIDISAFPTGSKLMILLTGFMNTPSGEASYMWSTYNSVKGPETWQDNRATQNTANSLANVNVITKIASVDTVYVDIASNQSVNTVAITAVIMRIG